MEVEQQIVNSRLAYRPISIALDVCCEVLVKNQRGKTEEIE